MKDISLPISKDLEKFNKFMKENLRSDVQIIYSILNYIEQYFAYYVQD